jgi:transposase
MKSINILYVGIDIALNKFDVEYRDIFSNSFNTKKNHSFANTPEGVDFFIDSIIFIAKNNDFNKVFIGYEATNNYGFHLPFMLTESEDLKPFEPVIYQINPKIIKNFRKSFNDIPKTDSIDAFLIAERLKIGKLPPFTRFDPSYYALRVLTRSRFSFVMKMVSEKSRFISLLFISASGFTQTKLFSNILGATCSSLLTSFKTTDEIVNMDIKDLISFLVSKSKNHFKDPEFLAKQVKYVAKNSFKIDRALHDPINYALIASYSHINYLSHQIKTLDDEINRYISTFQNQYAILTSIKGIGKVISMGIIAELGNLTDFSSQDQVAKYAGLVWGIKESGKFKSEEKHLTKSGNRYLRYYLVEAAQCLITFNNDFIPYFKTKYGQSVKHKHKRALIFVARKFVRVIYCLLKNNKLYVSPASKDIISHNA